MKFMQFILAFALVFYLGALGLLYLFQDRLTFPAYVAPIPGTPEAEFFPEFKEVTIPTADGLKLRAWFAPPKDPSLPVAVHFHGNASSLAWRAPISKSETNVGYGALITSYRGYSGNPGRPSEEGLYTDGRAALAWLKSQGYENVILQGESLGSGVAVQLAMEGYGKALILEAPYISMPEVGAHHYWFVPVRQLLRHKFDNLSKIGKVHIPVLVMGGGADIIVPHSHHLAVFNAANEPKTAFWAPRAGHINLYDNGGGKVVLDFLNPLFKPSPTP